MTNKEEIKKFINEWQDASLEAKEVFINLKNYLEAKKDIEFSFNARPNISYSLRAKHKNQKERNLFVMLDVIDDDINSGRWFSICFYDDMINDPKEKGDLIPKGLLGEDGYCFDLEDFNDENINYIKARLDEAIKNSN